MIIAMRETGFLKKKIMKKLIVTILFLITTALFSQAQIITTIAGNGAAGYSGDGGPAVSAVLNHPFAITTDTLGNIFFADYNNNRVAKINPAGIITTLAGNGTNGFFGDGGAATAAELANPSGVAVDRSGNVYIADKANQRIRMVNTSGVISTIGGNGTPGYTGDETAATTAEIDSPSDIAVDAGGNILIADYTNQVIRQINTVGIITTIAGNNTAGYSGDGGAATAAALNNPAGVCTDASGNIYVACAGNNVIRMINSAGIISTFAGNTTPAYSGDGGAATAASINYPKGMTVDRSGNFYFADQNNSVIRKINTSGIITTVAGTNVAGFSGDCGAATAAKLNFPAAVAVDTSGNLFIADNLNMRIREVSPGMASVTGVNNICATTSTNYSDATAGGTWSSANTFVATVGSATGVVTGQSAGTASIIYTLPTGCTSFQVITVNPQPITPSSITGPLSVCESGTIILSNGISGGIWSSTAPGTASVGSVTGIVTGVSAGTATISYTTTNSCGSAAATAVVTVNALPSSITGNAPVCAGFSVALTDITTGGTWSSSAPTVATVNSSGSVSGLVAGSSFITYTTPANCIATTIVTVNLQPGPILGPQALCTGTTTILSDAPTIGTWSSSNTAAATVGSVTGIVSAVGTGTAAITYLLPGGCSSSVIVTVNPAPSSITGNTPVCAGFAIALTDITTGGTWSSSVPTVATIGSTGLVSGLVAGTSFITYTTPANCIATTVVTVNLQPGPILGPQNLCSGTTTILSDAPTTGTWSSSNTAIATVGSVTGIVSAGGLGTAVITYLLPDGCFAAVAETVNPLPSAITGTAVVCAGSSTNLSDATPGGTWSSGSPAIASAGTSGVIFGLVTGNSNITYTAPDGCIATQMVTVNFTPGPILGTATLCVSSTAILSDAPVIGTWSSSNTLIATVGSATGIITGTGAGLVGITYTLPDGCYSARLETLNPLPNPIAGVVNICTGFTATVSDSDPGGTWASSATTIASISTAGVVTGLLSGTSIISYTLPTGCKTVTVVTVNSSIGVIAGAANICTTQSATLSDTPAGGTWSSSAAGVATIGSSDGMIAAISVGTAVITYTMPSGCYVTRLETVGLLPGVITGVTALCAGTTTALTDATAGGTWSSGSTIIATVGTSGLVAGLSAGITNISYSMPGGCAVTAPVTVNVQPGNITGTNNICITLSTILGDSPSSGAWSSSDPSTVVIGTYTGILTAMTVGTAMISYILPDGCFATLSETVNPEPAPISGVASVCEGFTTTLTDASGTGVWNSESSSIASVSGSGVVSGVSTGTTHITLTVPTGCRTVTVVTVNLQPGIIAGSPTVCAFGTTILGNLPYTGTWSSGAPGVATIGASTGILTAASAGTAVISYILPEGCFATLTETVNPVPTPIFGVASVCEGFTTALTDTSGTGLWNSTSGSIATVNSIGLVSGISTGTTNITFTVPTGCITVTVVTVNLQPGVISGSPTVCALGTTILGDLPYTGTWSSGTPGVATIGASTGILTAASAGTTVISYILPEGCFATLLETVNPLPAAITGTTNVCTGLTTNLSDSGSGTWSATSAAIATIGSSTGVVTGVAGGITTITYTIPTGCITTTLVTVNTVPGAIIGTGTVCLSSGVILYDLPYGGAWSSGSTGIATIDPVTGNISGVAVGTTIITYTLSTGCLSTTVETVTPLPGPITGTAGVCAGDTIALSDGSTGGTWNSASTLIATVGTSGVVTGVNTGTTVISYVLPTGCAATTIVTINTHPGAILGSPRVCVGVATILSDLTTGGVWSSSSPVVATVGSLTGFVTGLLAGTTNITYQMPGGCGIVLLETVNPVPADITGGVVICQGATTALTDITPGGTWSAGITTIAGVGSTGIITGLVPGITSIVYTLPTSCKASVALTVNPQPAPISGPTSICDSATVIISDPTHDGVWSSGTTAVATVGAETGIVTATATGTVAISYSLAGGCFSLFLMTINALPAPVSGTAVVCQGSPSVLSDATTGGTWTSQATAVATINATTGAVTALESGSSVISYSLPDGCSTTIIETVNPTPQPIEGTPHVCVGVTTVLGDISHDGVWTSSNTGIATVGAETGIVTGVSGGIATITYTLPAGCFTTITVTDSCDAGLNTVAGGKNNITIFPNSNNGTFTIKGSVGTIENGEVFVDVKEMTGRVVYNDKLIIQNGAIAGEIALANTLANGMYLLTLHAGNENAVFHFVIMK